MEQIRYSYIEWTIENFSCWRYEIHSTKLELPKSEVSFCLDTRPLVQLYPRGASGREKHLVLNFCDPWFSSDLKIYYIGSDGSVIKTESLQQTTPTIDLREPRKGPVFKDIVALIRDAEPYHKDSLTIRFQRECDFLLGRHLRIQIYALNLCMKMNSKIFRDPSSIKENCWNVVSRVQYPTEDGVGEFWELQAYKIESNRKTHVKLKIVPLSHRRTRTVVVISTYHQSGKGPVVKFQELERVFSESCFQVSLKSLPIQDDERTSFYITLRLKIITMHVFKMYSQESSVPTDVALNMANSYQIVCTAASQQPETSGDVLAKELTGLFQNQDFTDFQFRCGQQSFPVHKGILSARSPVLKVMLSTSMREAETGVVVIEDLDVPTLSRFLGFLYSGKVVDFHWKSALKLYYAADKYEVPSLKKECVSVLSADVSVSNICEIMTLAYRHQDERLMSVVNEFIVQNYGRICETEEWMNLVSDNQGFFHNILSEKRGPSTESRGTKKRRC